VPNPARHCPAPHPRSFDTKEYGMVHVSLHRNHDRSSLRAFGETLAAVGALNALGAGAGILAGSGGDGEWYTSLEKPSFQPPSWVFGPVWTTLYTMMGVSLSLLWHARRSKPDAANPALQLFTIQLLMNLLWSFLFFRWQQPKTAFVEIIILNMVIILTILAAWRVSKVAALLLVPYLLWSMFASILNGAIWSLNR
jgi:tryptophan-rich sensory protein